MSFLGKLFGKKAPPPAPPPLPAAPAAPADPAKDPNMIRVHDAYGRELFITKQQWRDNVLLGHLQKVWNQPDDLYNVIVQSLQDGFGADMVKPAEQLAKIDPNKERGAVVLGIVYREQKRLDDAERVLRRFMESHGETGSALTNLAKVQTDRGQADLALQTLWHGLEIDPNQDNGLGWYEVIHREKEGPAGGLAALRRIAALPGSWRARLWLARDALTRRQRDEALALYDEAFALAPRPVPTDLLQQVSGDLGNHAHLVELLRLTEPHFDVVFHGLAVGNNLIKANLDLGRLEAVQALLDRHYAQKRPDWKETLSYWDNELAKMRVSLASAPAKPDIQMLSGDGPVWLTEGAATGELFPAAVGEPIYLAFLGSTFSPTSGDKEVHQLSNDPGRFSRAIPMFLAEQVYFRGVARVRPLVPWMRGEAPSFVVCGVPWKDEEAAHFARVAEPPADYVVTAHLQVAPEPWRVTVRVIRTIDARCLSELSAGLPKTDLGAGLRPLADRLLGVLAGEAQFRIRPAPALYELPGGNDFGHYLVRLEQLLAARCAGMPGMPGTFLHGVRDIIDANLDLCLRQPGNVVTRIVLGETLRHLKKVQPAAVEEFREKVLLLQKEKPLPPPAQAVLQRMFTEVYP